jgi:deoxyhypusine synthase
LKASDFREFITQVQRARQKEKAIVFMIGAHVIKVGLSPVLIDLMENQYISVLAMHGAGAIHDVEVSYFGQTSENVAEGLADGSFGMAQETGEFINQTAKEACDKKLGFGEALGKRISQEQPPLKKFSLLARAYECNIPATVHVALGTDIIHQQPSVDGAALGEASLMDFKILTHIVSKIADGGVVINCGSSVILPEVFLKALTVARNLFGEIKNFATANFDMIQHYRPTVNVVERPTLQGGKGYQFFGHHEIMIPLLAAALKEAQ